MYIWTWLKHLCNIANNCWYLFSVCHDVGWFHTTVNWSPWIRVALYIGWSARVNFYNKEHVMHKKYCSVFINTSKAYWRLAQIQGAILERKISAQNRHFSLLQNLLTKDDKVGLVCIVPSRGSNWTGQNAAILYPFMSRCEEVYQIIYN